MVRVFGIREATEQQTTTTWCRRKVQGANALTLPPFISLLSPLSPDLSSHVLVGLPVHLRNMKVMSLALLLMPLGLLLMSQMVQATNYLDVYHHGDGCNSELRVWEYYWCTLPSGDTWTERAYTVNFSNCHHSIYLPQPDCCSLIFIRLDAVQDLFNDDQMMCGGTVFYRAPAPNEVNVNARYCGKDQFWTPNSSGGGLCMVDGTFNFKLRDAPKAGNAYDISGVNIYACGNDFARGKLDSADDDETEFEEIRGGRDAEPKCETDTSGDLPKEKIV